MTMMMMDLAPPVAARRLGAIALGSVLVGQAAGRREMLEDGPAVFSYVWDAEVAEAWWNPARWNPNGEPEAEAVARIGTSGDEEELRLEGELVLLHGLDVRGAVVEMLGGEVDLYSWADGVPGFVELRDASLSLDGVLLRAWGTNPHPLLLLGLGRDGADEDCSGSMVERNAAVAPPEWTRVEAGVAQEGFVYAEAEGIVDTDGGFRMREGRFGTAAGDNAAALGIVKVGADLSANDLVLGHVRFTASGASSCQTVTSARAAVDVGGDLVAASDHDDVKVRCGVVELCLRDSRLPLCQGAQQVVPLCSSSCDLTVGGGVRGGRNGLDSLEIAAVANSMSGLARASVRVMGAGGMRGALADGVSFFRLAIVEGGARPSEQSTAEGTLEVAGDVTGFVNATIGACSLSLTCRADANATIGGAWTVVGSARSHVTIGALNEVQSGASAAKVQVADEMGGFLRVALGRVVNNAERQRRRAVDTVDAAGQLQAASLQDVINLDAARVDVSAYHGCDTQIRAHADVRLTQGFNTMLGLSCASMDSCSLEVNFESGCAGETMAERLLRVSRIPSVCIASCRIEATESFAGIVGETRVGVAMPDPDRALPASQSQSLADGVIDLQGESTTLRGKLRAKVAVGVVHGSSGNVTGQLSFGAQGGLMAMREVQVGTCLDSAACSASGRLMLGSVGINNIGISRGGDLFVGVLRDANGTAEGRVDTVGALRGMSQVALGCATDASSAAPRGISARGQLELRGPGAWLEASAVELCEGALVTLVGHPLRDAASASASAVAGRPVLDTSELVVRDGAAIHVTLDTDTLRGGELALPLLGFSSRALQGEGTLGVKVTLGQDAQQVAVDLGQVAAWPVFEDDLGVLSSSGVLLRVKAFITASVDADGVSVVTLHVAVKAPTAAPSAAPSQGPAAGPSPSPSSTSSPSAAASPTGEPADASNDDGGSSTSPDAGSDSPKSLGAPQGLPCRALLLLVPALSVSIGLAR